MFEIGIVGGGIGETHARSRSAVEGVKVNVLRDVKPDTVVYLKAPGK